MVNPLSWEDFSGAEQGQSKQSELPQEAKEPSWDEFLTPETYQGEKDPEAESILAFLSRNIVTSGSRLLEQRLGRKGNIEKAFRQTVQDYPATTGILGWAISELVGPEEWKKLTASESQIFPTSETLKDISQTITGGYTAPKSKGEEKFQGLVEDIGSILQNPRNMDIRTFATRNIGVPVAANIAKELAEYTGFKNGIPDIVKSLTWIGLGTAAHVNGPQYASDMMNRGRQIPDHVRLNNARLLRNLDNLENNYLFAPNDPRSQIARQQIGTIRQMINNGQDSVRAAQTSYDGLNATKRARGMFELGRADRNFARARIDQVRDVLRDEIMDSGRNYPQVMQEWQNGINAWAAIHRSNAITNTFKDLAQGPYAKVLIGPATALFGGGAYGLSQIPVTGSVGVPAIGAGYKGLQLLYRVWQDPNLLRYYTHAISDLVMNNAPKFVKDYVKLNKGVEKLESSDKNHHNK